MEYITYRIGDIAKLSAGGDCPVVCSDNKSIETPIPIYSNGIDNEGLYGYTDKARIEGDTITVSARGVNIGTVFYRPEPYLPIVRLIAVVPDRNIVDAKYLYYYFQGVEIGGTGSAQPQIPVPFFSRKKICIHRKIEQQKAIARTLSMFDELIKVNEKRIKILEQMAENLYKEWFVRFRFPGHEDAEFENGIPKGWYLKHVSEVGEVVAGGTPSTAIEEYWNGDIPWLTPADLSVFSGIYISKGKTNISELGLKKSSATMMPEKTVLLSSRAPIGYVALARNEICTNQGFKSVVCNDSIISYSYLFYFFKMNKSTLECYGTGATFPELSAKGLKKIKILLPPIDIQKKFEKIAESIAEEIYLIQEKNSNLIKQRDLLLPRLMSGKLQVK